MTIEDRRSEEAGGGRVETFAASDGYRLHYRRYAPRGEARGRVVCIHGIQSHGGWYTGSCAYLAERGWEVEFLDRRGSGLNQEARGDTPGWRRIVADLAEFARRKEGPAPLLVAISWGGKVALALERLHPGSTRGIALLAPGLCPRVKPALGQRLKIALSRVVAPGRRFRIPLDDPELFTATPERQAFIRDDPLALREGTARLLVASVVLGVAARRSVKDVKVPVLLMLAGRDRIIDNAKTRAYFERLASAEKEVIEYPEAHHTFEFEPGAPKVFADLAGWLARHGG